MSVKPRSTHPPSRARRFAALFGRKAQTLLDAIVLAGAFLLAYVLRFDLVLGPTEWQRLKWQMPMVVAIQLLSGWAWGIHRFLWRYVGLSDLRAFIGAALTSLVALLGLRFGVPNEFAQFRVPGSISFIDVGLAFLATVGIRVVRRMLFEWNERKTDPRRTESAAGTVKVLLVGAGKAGLMAIREIHGRARTQFDVKGFVDDDRGKHGSVIAGVPVLGSTEEIPTLVGVHAIDELIITITKASRSEIRRVVDLCEQTNAKVRIIPGFHEILSGKVGLSQIRNVEIEDLLGRDAVTLETNRMRDYISGKGVMVTGAGGSIGSELVRQIARFSPLRVLLVDRSEFALYQIDDEMQRLRPQLMCVPLLADVGDPARMRALFKEYRPAIVFHAAACKHVPLVELNPGEAVKNNIFGTLTAGELAGEFGAEAFVLISTDKAVNPTSVMGTTKRAAELVVQMLDRRFKTAFVSVRFGNVLGSTGSVVPRFREQIARGGPVTVTHPEMRRYFMTIPEAAQLVLQAGALGKGGEVLILDMGEPVRIVDLACDMIRLSGLVPNDDIEIVFTGIRPGEKLFEELGASTDDGVRTGHEKILLGRASQVSAEDVMPSLGRLRSLCDEGDGQAVREELHRLVPESTVVS